MAPSSHIFNEAHNCEPHIALVHFTGADALKDRTGQGRAVQDRPAAAAAANWNTMASVFQYLGEQLVPCLTVELVR